MSDADNYREWADSPRSVSQVVEYEACAYKSFLKRVQKVPIRPAAWINHGLAFHSAIEAFEKSERTLAREQVVTVFQDVYSGLTNQDMDRWVEIDEWLRGGRGTASADIELRYQRGSQQVRRYVDYVSEENPVIWKTDGVPAIELPFSANFGGVVVRGFIDQVLIHPDGSLVVRDLKTGTTRNKFQLWVYILALRQVYSDRDVAYGDWYLARDHRVSQPVLLSEAYLDGITGRIVAMDYGVKAGSFPANPGQNCYFCEVSHACRFYSP